MTHEESKKLLNDYFDEKLSLEENTEIQVHLSECDECSQYLFSLQDLMKEVDKLPRSVKPPNDFWQEIFSSISQIKEESIKQKEELYAEETKTSILENKEEEQKRKQKIKAEKLLEWEKRKAFIINKLKTPLYRNTFIGLGVVLFLVLVYNLFFSSGSAWEVKKYSMSTDAYESFSVLKEGEILETDEYTRYEILVPDVGNIYLGPSTKIERSKSFNIRLLQGTVSKSKSDAKKFLIFEVFGADIKDYLLGSSFRLALLNPAFAELEVKEGWISVTKNDKETLILPHHLCKIHSDFGVGLPYNQKSSGSFIETIEQYCFIKPGNEEVLINLLSKAEIKDGLTLWNLLKRVERKQRDMVIYTILGLLGNPPEGVTPDGLKVLNAEMLSKLLDEIKNLL